MTPQEDLSDYIADARQRPSVVDAIENTLGATLTAQTPGEVLKLSSRQQEELAHNIDELIDAQTRGSFDPVGSVFLDDSMDADTAYFSGEPPEVSEKVRKLLLYFPEVLVPWGDLSGGLEICGPEYLSYAVRYAANHKLLLQEHALTLVSPSAVRDDGIESATLAAAMANSDVAFAKYAKPYLPVVQHLADERVVEDVQAFLLSLYKDIAYAGVLGVEPVVLDYSKRALLQYHLEAGLRAPLDAIGAEGRAGNALVSLDLPALADLSIADLVALRRNADEYHQWRSSLGRVLRRTSERAQDVDDVQRVFYDESDLLVEKAARIKEKVGQSGLAKHLKATTERVAVGLGAAAATQQVLAQLGQRVSLQGDLLRSAPFVGLSVIWWFLFNRAKPTSNLLLKFYHAVTDEQ